MLTPLSSLLPETPPAGHDSLRLHVFRNDPDGSTSTLLDTLLFLSPLFTADVESLIRADLRQRRVPAGRFGISWSKPDGSPLSGKGVDVLHNIFDDPVPQSAPGLRTIKILAGSDALLLNPAVAATVPLTFHADCDTTLTVTALRRSGVSRRIRTERFYFDEEGDNPLGIFSTEVDLPVGSTSDPIVMFTISIAQTVDNSVADQNAPMAETQQLKIYCTNKRPVAEITACSQYLTPQKLHYFGRWQMSDSSQSDLVFVNGRPTQGAVPSPESEIVLESEPLSAPEARLRKAIGYADSEARVRLFMGADTIAFTAFIKNSQNELDHSDQSRITHKLTLQPALSRHTMPGLERRTRIFTGEFTAQFL